jgi:hypothetical protein
MPKPAASRDTPSPRYWSASLSIPSQPHKQSPDGSFKCNTLPRHVTVCQPINFAAHADTHTANHNMGPTLISLLGSFTELNRRSSISNFRIPKISIIFYLLFREPRYKGDNWGLHASPSLFLYYAIAADTVELPK